jgi:hypothetical protein
VTDAEIRVFCGHEVKVTRASDHAEFSGRLDPDLEKPGLFHVWIGQSANGSHDATGPREDFSIDDFERIDSLGV